MGISPNTARHYTERVLVNLPELPSYREDVLKRGLLEYAQTLPAGSPASGPAAKMTMGSGSGVGAGVLVGGGVAVGSYKLLEDENVVSTEQQQYPSVRYTSEMRSSAGFGMNRWAMPSILVAWRPAHEQKILNATGWRTAVIRPGVVYGGSAGGQLAILEAVTCGAEPSGADKSNPSVSDCPQAAVGWYGIYDFPAMPSRSASRRICPSRSERRSS